MRVPVTSFEDDAAELQTEPEARAPDVEGTARFVGDILHVDIKNVPKDVAEGQILHGDWTFVFHHFRLDPALFTIVNDTVESTSWAMARGKKETDTWEPIWLYRYKVKFQRNTGGENGPLSPEDVEALRERVRKWKPVRRTPGLGLGEPATFYVGAADWQLGKRGTKDIVIPRLERTIDATVNRVKELRRIGRNIESIEFWDMGDGAESVAGHYSTQAFGVELNQRDQCNTKIDLTLNFIHALVPLAERFKHGCCICNHGENRQGGKKISDDADNLTPFMAEQVKRALEGRPDFDHIEYAIPRDEMVMTSNMSGVWVMLSHGHTMQANEREWLRGQAQRVYDLYGFMPELGVTAHKHAFGFADYGPFAHLKCPSCDADSKWFTDLTALYSEPGTLTALIGRHAQALGRGWSDLEVL